MSTQEKNITAIKELCEEFKKNNKINSSLYETYTVKRGLRNADGTGVLAGLTQICNVHGYIINEGEREAIAGELFYRGYNVADIVTSCANDKRFGFEETVYLLLFGILPDKDTLARFQDVISSLMELPQNFFEDMILKAPSPNIMNKMARSVLALYSYDENGDDITLEVEIMRALHLISRMCNIMVKAYQVKVHHYDQNTMFLHPLIPNISIAEEILSLLRPGREYTKEEALLLDRCLILHAEHGGGNCSTFAARVLSSSLTDAYSAYAGAIGALKGPRHGGANIEVLDMIDDIKANVKYFTDKTQVCDYLVKIMNKQAGDGTGLVYGMGHAVYTVSDPRALILKQEAAKIVVGTQYEDDLALLNIIEQETPRLFVERGNGKPICANVDLYSGLIYQMLKIPRDLFTPLFATARMSGWAAHRIEELLTGGRIIRPAYKSISKPQAYVGIDQR